MSLDPDEIIAFERASIHYQSPPPSPAEAIQIHTGTVPILFSAPHSTRHRRAGRWKQEDEYTAAITETMHRVYGTHAMYAAYELDPDPHDDGPENSYKQRIAEFLAAYPVKLVVDLHGARGDRDFGIAVGTIRGVSCPDYEPLVVDLFAQEGFRQQGYTCSLDRLVLNHPLYTGGLVRPTITRFVSEQLNIAAVQIEMNAWLRVLERLPTASEAQRHPPPYFFCDRERFLRVMGVFSRLVDAVSP